MSAPKKKAARPASAASSATPPPDEHEQLVMKCPRTVLEQVILESLRRGVPVSLTTLEAACKTPDKAPVTVGCDAAFENAGLFSLLPPDAMCHIFKHLGHLSSKLTFAIEICKGLRTLREINELWTTVGNSVYSFNNNHGYEDVDWINGKGMLRLANWLPDRSQVDSLTLHASKGRRVFAPDDVGELLSMFADISSLRLSGQGVVKKVILALAATERPKMRHLILDWPSQLGMQSILNVLKQMPNLRTFEASHLSGEMLASYSSMLRTARGGGVPLLTGLFQNSTYDGTLSIFDAVRAGAQFPELTDLRVVLKETGPNPALPAAPLIGSNLLRLHVGHLCRQFAGGSDNTHLSSSALQAVIRLFTVSCPRLESLIIAHGRKYVSAREPLPPFPSLGNSFQQFPLPESIVFLHLQDIIVGPENFDGVRLPNLLFLRLVCCGGGEMTWRELAASDAICPKLTPRGCVCRELTGEERPPKKETTSEKNKEKQTPLYYTMHHRYPRSDLAGLSFDDVIVALEDGHSDTWIG